MSNVKTVNESNSANSEIVKELIDSRYIGLEIVDAKCIYSQSKHAVHFIQLSTVDYNYDCNYLNLERFGHWYGYVKTKRHAFLNIMKDDKFKAFYIFEDKIDLFLWMADRICTNCGEHLSRENPQVAWHCANMFCKNIDIIIDDTNK